MQHVLVCVRVRMSFDLSSYLDKFAAVCEAKFGRSYDLSELEKRLSVHRDWKKPSRASGSDWRPCPRNRSH